MAVGLYGLVQPGPQGEEGSSNQKGLARAARVGVSPGCPIENIVFVFPDSLTCHVRIRL